MHWNLPGGEISLVDPVAAVYDNAILHAPWRLTGRPVASFLGFDPSLSPGRHGGLGYTTWSQTADATYFASYVHISHVFPSLFPCLSGAYPSSLLWLRRPMHRRAQGRPLRVQCHAASGGPCFFSGRDRPRGLSPANQATLARFSKKVGLRRRTVVYSSLCPPLTFAAKPSVPGLVPLQLLRRNHFLYFLLMIQILSRTACLR